MKTGYGQDEIIVNKDGLYCFRCDEILVSGKVFLQYLVMNAFPTHLLKCPKCGLVYIDENMVMTKAAEVERTIEEK